MYDSFVECVNQVYLPNGVLCPYGYVWKALREYSPYVRQQMAGFDSEQCRGRIRYRASDFFSSPEPKAHG